MQPLSRTAGLLFEEIDDELVVYDQDRDRAHRLNGTAARVWKLCDGSRAVPELAAALAGEGGAPDEEVVRMALEQLGRADLLATPPPPAVAGVTRREAMQRLVKVAGVGLLLPVVTSISAPTPADAQSHGPGKDWKGEHGNKGNKENKGNKGGKGDKGGNGNKGNGGKKK